MIFETPTGRRVVLDRVYGGVTTACRLLTVRSGFAALMPRRQAFAQTADAPTWLKLVA
jgi:hypothetical protein